MRYLSSGLRELGHARTWTERLYLFSPLGQAVLKDLIEGTGIARARNRRIVATMTRGIAAEGAESRAGLGANERLPVRAGPFAGMLYEDFASGSVFGAKVLGPYENEIAGWFETAVRANYTHFIDVGCAEGYYAVGMALRDPALAIHAFDINPDAQAMTRRLAEINGVAGRVTVDGVCDAARVQDLAATGRALLLVDIEGFEDFLLDPQAVPALRSTDIIVETHEHAMPGVTFRLLGRFAETHRIDAIAAVPDACKIASADARSQCSPREGRRLPQIWLRLQAWTRCANPDGGSSLAP